MNKKLLAVAIASALATPFALADEGNVTISGNLVGAISSFSIEGIDGGVPVDTTTANVAPGGSDLSISGWESLGNGLKAVFVLKSWVNVTGNFDQGDSQPIDGAGLATTGGPGALLFGRNKDAYLGLSGDFGTVALGAHGQPYKTATGGLELFGDSIGDARGGVTNAQGAFHSGIGDAVMWFLPNMNGISGHLQVGAENNVDNDPNAWGAQLNYSNGPFYGTFAYADNDQPLALGVQGSKIGVGISFGATKISGIVENIDGGAADGDSYTLGLAHTFGANTAKIQYASADYAGTSNNAHLWAVGLDHSLSKRTKLFALYASGEETDIGGGTDLETSGVQLGMAHSF